MENNFLCFELELNQFEIEDNRGENIPESDTKSNKTNTRHFIFYIYAPLTPLTYIIPQSENVNPIASEKVVPHKLLHKPH